MLSEMKIFSVKKVLKNIITNTYNLNLYDLKQCKSHQLILIRGNRGELGLGEDKTAVALPLDVGDLSGVVVRPLDKVNTRLELVHRVQDHLHKCPMLDFQKNPI